MCYVSCVVHDHCVQCVTYVLRTCYTCHQCVTLWFVKGDFTAVSIGVCVCVCVCVGVCGWVWVCVCVCVCVCLWCVCVCVCVCVRARSSTCLYVCLYSLAVSTDAAHLRSVGCRCRHVQQQTLTPPTPPSPTDACRSAAQLKRALFTLADLVQVT